jgi:hypothetical protein
VQWLAALQALDVVDDVVARPSNVAVVMPDACGVMMTLSSRSNGRAEGCVGSPGVAG